MVCVLVAIQDYNKNNLFSQFMGELAFGEVDGLLEAGRIKSSLLQHQSNSSP